MYNFLSMLGGGFLAQQSAVNSLLSKRIKSTLLSVSISFGIGTLLLLSFYIIQGNYVSLNSLSKIPMIDFSSGIFAFLVVTLSVVIFPKIGPIETAIFPIVGQLFFSILVNSLGLFNSSKINISSISIMGIFIILIGVIVTIYQKNSLEKKITNIQLFIYRLLGFLAGGSLIFAQSITSKLAIEINNPTLSGFFAVLLAAIVSFIFFVVTDRKNVVNKISLIKKTPPLFFTGGIFGPLYTLIMSYSVPKIGITTGTLMSVAGLILGSVIISVLGLWEKEKEKIRLNQIIGILVMLVGLFIYFQNIG